MRSESTSAFGQPSETKPTFGAFAPRLAAGPAARRALALVFAAAVVDLGVRRGDFRRASGERASDAEVTVAGLDVSGGVLAIACS